MRLSEHPWAHKSRIQDSSQACSGLAVCAGRRDGVDLLTRAGDREASSTPSPAERHSKRFDGTRRSAQGDPMCMRTRHTHAARTNAFPRPAAAFREAPRRPAAVAHLNEKAGFLRPQRVATTSAGSWSGLSGAGCPARCAATRRRAGCRTRRTGTAPPRRRGAPLRVPLPRRDDPCVQAWTNAARSLMMTKP